MLQWPMHLTFLVQGDGSKFTCGASGYFSLSWIIDTDFAEKAPPEETVGPVYF